MLTRSKRWFKRKSGHAQKKAARLYAIMRGKGMRGIQQIPDKEFFSHFDADRIPGFAHAGSTEVQRQALLEHFRARTSQDWLKTSTLLTDLYVDFSQMSRESIIAKANAIVAGELENTGERPHRKPSGTVDWSVNPTSDFEWQLWLHRHAWWGVLTRAYEIKRDERYADYFVTEMLDWVRSNPPPSFKDESHAPWRLMEVGMRMRTVWIPAFGTFYSSPAFTDDAKLTMLRSIWEHGKFLNLFYTNRNHLLRESNGLGFVGAWFPEFKDSHAWLEAALARLDSELALQVNDDGSHIEVSIGYQLMVVDEFEQTLMFMRKAGMQLPNQDLGARLEKMYELLLATLRPDGTFPEINDGLIFWTRACLTEAGEVLGRQDFIYGGTGGASGTLPAFTSTAFPDAGLHVMRDGWASNDHYLLFDAGPYGGPHGHEDKMSVEICANGKAFIVDSGSYTYSPNDSHRNYFVSSAGHNTVTVDGLSQIRRGLPGSLEPVRKRGNYALWATGDDFDYVSAAYEDGYGPFSIRPERCRASVTDVVHRRHILFVKPHYWLIIDELLANSKHEYQLMYHAHPDVRGTVVAKDRVSLDGGSAGVLNLIAASGCGVSAQVSRGAENPAQGWFSPEYGTKVEADATIFSTPRSKNAVIATLVYPSAKTLDDVSLTLTSLSEEGTQSDEGLAWKITHPGGEDYIFVSNTPRDWRTGDYLLSGQVAALCLDSEGQTRRRFEWSPTKR